MIGPITDAISFAIEKAPNSGASCSGPGVEEVNATTLYPSPCQDDLADEDSGRPTPNDIDVPVR